MSSLVAVSKRLPKTSNLCLVYYAWDGRPQGYALDRYAELQNVPGTFRWGIEWGMQPIKVTHWMPVPPAPTKEAPR